MALLATPDLASRALAAAGSVAEMTGTVLVNTGHGFVPAKADTALPPGASVMVRNGGRATLAFDDGCRVVVRPGVVVVVTKISPCKRRGKAVSGTMQAPEGEGIVGVTAPVEETAVLGIPIQGAIIGGAAAAVVAVTAAVVATEGSSSP